MDTKAGKVLFVDKLNGNSALKCTVQKYWHFDEEHQWNYDSYMRGNGWRWEGEAEIKQVPTTTEPATEPSTQHNNALNSNIKKTE